MFYPQLTTGALVQYPLERRHTERVILTVTEDGRTIALADPNGDSLRWTLIYEGLSDVETRALATFFQTCEGSLQSFTFVDPAANLLSYSEDFTQPAWQKNFLLEVSPLIADPEGSNRASRLTNTSAGELSITQTIPLPGAFTTTFSVYLRSDQPATIALSRTDGSTIRSVTITATPSWTRYLLSSTFASSISNNNDFSIGIPTGVALDIFGPQVEAQPSAGVYVPTSGFSNVYQECRFVSDKLLITATGPGQSRGRLEIMTKVNE